MAWTDERVELLKKYWSEGLSSSQIAYRIGDCTRNGVIGKLYRLGLTGRMPVVRSKAPRRQRREYQHRGTLVMFAHGDKPAEPLPPPSETDIARVSFADLEPSKHCRWPVGDPKQAGFGFCGCTPVPGLPYCEHHARRAIDGLRPARVNAFPGIVAPLDGTKAVDELLEDKAHA